MSKDKSLNERLKGFFKSLNKGSAVPRTRNEEFIVLSDELQADLKSNSPTATRVKAAKELAECCKVRRAESHTIEKIWALVNDLLRPEVAKDTRHLIFGLLNTLCQSQPEKSGFLRAKFFIFIKSHDVAEDVIPRFQFLITLTENGRDVSYFDEKIGPFLLEWMADRQTRNVNTAEFMSFLVNIIKFNQSFLDQDILMGIIQNVCIVSCTCSAKDDVVECLNVLSAVICYGSLPPGCLSSFLATLCRTVNIDTLCQTSWKVMRHLLGTHLGCSGLYTMCNFMENPERSDDVSVIRGAVFFVGVSLWGNKMIRSLKYSPNTVLHSFDKALERRHSLITFEVILRIQDLVKNNGESLQTVSWDLVVQIITKVITYANSHLSKEDPSRNVKIMKAVNDTLDSIEIIVETRSFCGPVDAYYQLVDKIFLHRPAPSVEKLMQYKVSTQIRSSKPMWFQNLISFTEKHLRREHRSGLKMKALNHITKICLATRDIYEEDLIDKIILPHMKNLENENDPGVRQAGVNFLVNFLMESCSRKGHDLLHILEKIVNRPYEVSSQSGPDTVHIFTDNEVLDIATAITGIVLLFKKKIYHMPSSIAVTTYKILVRHLGNHYKKPAVLDTCSSIRYQIFDCFFAIRANSLYHLGFPKGGSANVELSYSSYLAVDHRDGDEKALLEQFGLNQEATGNASPSVAGGVNSQSGNPQSSMQQFSGSGPGVTYISLTAACKLVVCSLKKEKDWKVLELVLIHLPGVLENKALILSKHGNDIDALATALCAMVTDKSLNLPECLRNGPPNTKFTRSDFQAFLYPILTALVSYHSYLDGATQGKIIKCLQTGLGLQTGLQTGMQAKSCRACILALTICTLEMKETMHKLVPEVLLNLSKMTPKVNIAIPVLEFLSTLLHLPRVFASFVQDQYMAIFAIALPYTNPFKFNQYTVSLSHHVIAMWFLKCRLSFRRIFVSYIIQGLENNVVVPMEEESRRYALELKNEDSSNRKRSSSLTEQSQKRRERPISGQTPNPGNQASRLHFDAKPTADKSLQLFHQELKETCIDFMARYAFADCSALPTRFPTTNFLISGGLSQSWMIEDRIITVTTSGCTQKELRDGVCDKCFVICRKQRTSDEGKLAAPQDSLSGPLIGRSLSVRGVNDAGSLGGSSNLANRRRHRSAVAGGTSKKVEIGSGGLQKSMTENSTGGNEEKKEVKDDLHLDHKLQPVVSFETSVLIEKEFNYLGGISPFSSEIAQKTKSEAFLCSCWCSGWAEILVRSPTGNTSWMMRVQNQIGNNNSTDIPLRDLSSIYLQNVVDTCQAEFLSNSATSSTLSSPTQTNQPSFVSQNSVSQDSVLTGSGGTVSPTIPGTPTTPDSPDDGDQLGSSRKNPVRRSNSSPEMSSTWKPSHVNLQKDIEEQDEDESPTSVASMKGGDSVKLLLPALDAKLITDSSANGPVSPSLQKAKDKAENASGGFSTASAAGLIPLKGNVSPFRQSYEAIPEENTHKGGKSSGSSPDQLDALGPIKRDRISTISVMTPARRNQVRRMVSLGGEPSGNSRFGSSGETGIRSGISPSFVFLQLCAQGAFGKGEKPLPLPSGENTAKSLRVLDYIPPYETHKIGVVYVGRGQAANETAILQNQYGSTRYKDFLQGLGGFIKLKEIDPQKVYIGGLCKDGVDGEFACIWQDDVMQVIFHTATLMPNKSSDPSGNFKKLHIGNDFVTIVYNNSDEEYDISTIKCQFLYACVVIQPLDHKTNRVTVKAKPGLADLIGHTDAKIVSDQNLPIMARQLALHSNLASVIFSKLHNRSDPYASNWLERLRQIKRLKSRLFPDSGVSSSEELAGDALPNAPLRRLLVEDFTEYV